MTVGAEPECQRGNATLDNFANYERLVHEFAKNFKIISELSNYKYHELQILAPVSTAWSNNHRVSVTRKCHGNLYIFI